MEALGSRIQGGGSRNGKNTGKITLPETLTAGSIYGLIAMKTHSFMPC